METLLITTNTTGLYLRVLDNPLPPHLRVFMSHLFAEEKEGRGLAQFLLNPIIANEDALRRWHQTADRRSHY